MPRPQQIPPTNEPSAKTPLPGEAQDQWACGDSYHLDFVVTHPYQGVSDYQASLSAVAPLIDVEVPYAEPVIGSIDAAIQDAQQTLDGQNPEIPIQIIKGAEDGGVQYAGGVIPTQVDNDNYDAITNLLQYAKNYLEVARQLWDYWAKEWKPDASPDKVGEIDVQQSLPSWPLDKGPIDALPFCEGKAAGAIAELPLHGETISVTCPNENTLALHTADVQVYMDLMKSALLYARCAQEAAYVVGLFYLNKRAAEQQPGDGDDIAAAPPVPDIDDPGSYPEGGFPGALPPNGLAAPAEKKKMGTPTKLLLGAAAGWAIWKFVLKR